MKKNLRKKDSRKWKQHSNRAPKKLPDDLTITPQCGNHDHVGNKRKDPGSNGTGVNSTTNDESNYLQEKEMKGDPSSMDQSASVVNGDQRREMENSGMNAIASEDDDYDKLKRLKELVDINPDVLQLFEQFLAFQKATQVNADVDNRVTRTASSRSNTAPNDKKVQPKTTPVKKNNTLSTVMKFSSKNGEMFVEKEVPCSTQIPQLGFSARLKCGALEFVIHSIGCLMITDDKLMAKVSLDRPDLLNDARDFQQAADVLLDQLRIDRVIQDELIEYRDKCREKFLAQLEHFVKRSDLEEGQVKSRIELMILLEGAKQRDDLTYIDLCRFVTSRNFPYNAIQEHAKDLEWLEHSERSRETLFNQFKFYVEDKSKHMLNRLDNLLREILDYHKEAILTKAPDYLKGPLRTISPNYLMIIQNNDMKLFDDMSSVLRADIFEKPLEDLAKRWITQVKSIKLDLLKEAPRLTSIIYFFLCKSLEEVIIEITEHTDHSATDLLMSSALGWYPIKKIVWKSEDTLTKCLQREYDFIFILLKHFEKLSDFGRKPFNYEMKMFKKDKSTSQAVLNLVKGVFDRTRRTFGFKKDEPNPFGVPDELYVWLCLLDYVLVGILPDDCELGLFGDVFEEYVRMIRDANYDQMETLRVLTHSLTRFIIKFCSDGGEWSSEDMNILRKQMDILSSKLDQSVNSAKNFRDHVDVFSSFWKTRRDIIDQFPTKIDLPEIYLMKEQLIDVMMIGLGKDVDVETRVAFFRTYNDFVIDLNEVSFDWYIKAIPEVDMQTVINLGMVELIDNKWKDTNNQTYRVLDPKNFSVYFETWTGDKVVPKHYIIEVIQTLLEFIGSQLQRTHWEADSANCLSDTDQVKSTNELIFAIRSSLLYLREQIDYVSFEVFYDERVKPFASVLTTTTSRQEFSSRTHLIKESFWYIRKQNEISFEDALQLYGELNSSHNSRLLREAYAKYSKSFMEFMQLSVDVGCSKRASLIAKKVKDQLSNPTQFKTWDNRFKQDQIPQILAGLSAVWSILVSKDVANAGKYFNPHCIQVLCVLRLLSVDKAERGMDKHLAQVLTGQGKSLVLGLLAALFALTGHKVRIACYSKYLAKRDKQDFLAFYEVFDVAENVTYGTFDDLANEIVAPKVGHETFGLRDLVSDLLFKPKAILPHRLVAADSSNDVLLMDEVDVFFTEEFYGKTYNPVCTPLIPGLDRIQEQIWKYVVAGWAKDDVRSRIDQFIECGEFEQREQFLEFLGRSNSYTLCEDGKTQRTYSNKILFDEHVGLMIQDANIVHYLPSTDWVKFRLNSDGIITYNKGGIYVTTCFISYYNVFNYFRLKKENFVTQVGWNENYGYLLIDCGSLSYAMLPMNYPLIVGVSGTLTSLNQYEKDTIERLYNIKQTSVMPSFFGCSNLQFDEVANFHHHASKPSWRTNIFSQANQMIAANRAVIVFFDTDVELNEFEAEYAGQLDRVNVLTENTEDKERFISEAGVAKTITLATRGMGRGVDYKSSVTVEKNGGVHVIQTFFSMDVKEEIQIKGRTARKDNKGSYELIVCEEDLKSSGLMADLNVVTYAGLDAARSKISLDKNAELSKKIQDHMDRHQNTMDYMRSFFMN